MKNLVFIFLVQIIFVGITAKASWFGSDEKPLKGCLETAPDLCAEIQFSTTLNSTEEQVFTVTIPSPRNIKNLSASLWMNMECGDQSHPGSPVIITPISSHQVEVRDAFFYMIGVWEIVVTFSTDDLIGEQEIRIPVEIKY